MSYAKSFIQVKAETIEACRQYKLMHGVSKERSDLATTIGTLIEGSVGFEDMSNMFRLKVAESNTQKELKNKDFRNLILAIDNSLPASTVDSTITANPYKKQIKESLAEYKAEPATETDHQISEIFLEMLINAVSNQVFGDKSKGIDRLTQYAWNKETNEIAEMWRNLTKKRFNMLQISVPMHASSIHTGVADEIDALIEKIAGIINSSKSGAKEMVDDVKEVVNYLFRDYFVFKNLNVKNSTPIKNAIHQAQNWEAGSSSKYIKKEAKAAIDRLLILEANINIYKDKIITKLKQGINRIAKDTSPLAVAGVGEAFLWPSASIVEHEQSNLLRVQAENDQLRATIQQLQLMLQQSEEKHANDVKASREKEEKLNEIIGEQTVKVQGIERERDLLISTIEEQVQKHSKIEEEHAHLVQGLQKQLSDFGELVQALKTRLNEEQGQNEEIIQDLKIRQTELINTITTQIEKLNIAEKAKAKLNNTIEILTENLKIAEEGHQHIVKELQDATTELTTTIGGLAIDLAGKQKENERLQSEIASLKINIANLTERVGSLTAQGVNLEDALRLNLELLKVEDHELNKAKATLERRTDERDSTRDEVLSLQQRIINLRTENKSLVESNRVLEQRMEQLRQDLTAERIESPSVSLIPSLQVQLLNTLESSAISARHGAISIQIPVERVFDDRVDETATTPGEAVHTNKSSIVVSQKPTTPFSSHWEHYDVTDTNPYVNEEV